MKTALILAASVAVNAQGWEDSRSNDSGDNWMENAMGAVQKMSETYQARARWEGDILKQYTADYWTSDIGKTMQTNMESLTAVIVNTADKVKPMMQKLDVQMKELKLEDMTAIGAQVRKMETNPLRQKVQQQLAEVQQTLGSGYGQVMQGLMQAQRKIDRAGNEYNRDMYKMQRKDWNEDRKIMRDMSKQARQGMRMVRNGFNDMERDLSRAVMQQQREGIEAFVKGYEGQAAAAAPAEKVEAPPATDEWNWD